MTSARIYHVGIVVPNLERAMAQLAEMANVSWGRVQHYAAELKTSSGQHAFEQTFVMSLEGPPYIELLMRLDGTVWERSGLHHLGMWSENVASESALAQARGCVWESATVDPQSKRASGWYHILPDLDARVELVSSVRGGARLQRYLAGGDY